MDIRSGASTAPVEGKRPPSNIPWPKSSALRLETSLLQDLRNGSGPDGSSAFSDGEAQSFFHGDGRDQVDLERHRVSRHHHLHSRGKSGHARHVGRAEEELRPIPREKRRVPAPLFLRQDVRLRLKLHVRRDRSRLGAHLPALDVFPLRATQEKTHVVPRLPLIQKLAEHLHSRDHLLYRRPDPHDLHFLAHLDHPTLDSSRHHRAPSRNREHVLDGHQKVLVDRPLGHRYVGVHRVHQLEQTLRRRRRRIPRLHRLQRRPLHHRYRLPRKTVGRQKLPHLQLHQLQKLRIVHHVRLVQKHHDVRNPNLPRQQHVLPRLGHRPVRRRNHQNRPVHLRRSRNHVLHVVRMTRTIYVRVMTLLRRILHVRRVDRDPSRLLLRRVVDLVVCLRRRQTLLRQHQRNRRRQRRLAVIHVPNRPDVHVRLAAIKLLLAHLSPSCLMEPTTRIELVTPSLPRTCSTD